MVKSFFELLLEKVNYLIKFKFSFFAIIYISKFNFKTIKQHTNNLKMYGYGGISASGLGGLLVGGAKPIRNRGDALRNMLDLENAEQQILHTVNTKKDIEAFRASKFGQVIARDEAQLARYRGQYNEDTLPIYLEREYLYSQGASGRQSNPHLKDYTEKDRRAVVAHYAQAMRSSKAGEDAKLNAFAQAYPEVFKFYNDRRLQGYVPAPRKTYDFSHVPMNPGFVPPGTHKVLNPVSGKMVSVNSAIGKRLVRRYMTGHGAGLTGY